MRNGNALKRLFTEYKEITEHAPDGVMAGPLDESDYFVWEAGPIGTCYDGGMFSAILTFPPDYPMNPPAMQFTTRIFHPNSSHRLFYLVVFEDGKVCISILHPPGDDPNMYESSSERWSPVQSIEKILLSVMSMLAEPNADSGANVEAAKLWRTDRQKFNEIAKECVRKSLGLPPM